MGKHRWFVFAAGLALALPTVVACATPTGRGGVAAGDSSSGTPVPPEESASSSAPSGSVSATGSPRPDDPGDMLDPQPPGTPKTLRGTGAAGVEPNCYLLNADDGKSYLLLGGDRQLILSGARLEVSVLVQPGLMSTCQQGIPATVVTMRKI